MKPLTPAAVRVLYFEILEDTAIIKKYSDYKKSKLRAYAIHEASTASELAIIMIETNPNYQYPEEVTEYEHKLMHMEHRILAYRDSQRVLQLLDSVSLASTPARAVGSAEAKPKTRIEKEKKVATLHNLSATEVRQLLIDVDMGRLYTSPGEWAAAFRALFTKGVLVGNAPEVHRWALKEGYVNREALSTLKKAWQEEKSQLDQFTKESQCSVFRKVSSLIDKKLIIKNLTGINK